MKSLAYLRRTLALAGLTAGLFLTTGSLSAQDQQPQAGQGRQGRTPGQGRGNFDPAEMRQRMMERYREALEIKGDEEWKVISERIEKVQTAQRDASTGRSGFGGFGRGGRGGEDGGRRGGGGGAAALFGGTPNPDVEALQKAVDAKASSDELKAKMARLRESTKERQAKLEKAQDDLRKLLTVRQEATAILMGLLK